MDNKQAKIFKEAYQEADTGDVDMSIEDWAQSTGLMHNYGHGYEWEQFTKAEAIAKIEKYAESLSECAESLSE